MGSAAGLGLQDSQFPPWVLFWIRLRASRVRAAGPGSPYLPRPVSSRPLLEETKKDPGVLGVSVRMRASPAQFRHQRL